MAREFSDSSRGIFKVTPLMMNSFSRLRGSDSGSRNQTVDSGYQSSFASSNNSFTPSTLEDSLANLYCSTPVASHSLSTNTTAVTHPTETPVSKLPSIAQYSEDRIPSIKITPLATTQEADDEIQSGVFSSLITWRITPTIRKILQFLGDEDLLNLCQVSDLYCQTVCNDQLALKRLSRFLINANQNGENRTTSSVNGRPSSRGILNPIHNLLNVNLSAGAVWTIPSPLENINRPGVPGQFKTLVQMTKEMSEFQYVSVCHSCRSMVAVRLHQQQQSVECSRCLQLSKRNTTRNRTGRKKKILLFPTLR